MKVIVIIPTFNSAQTIGRCLEAVLGGTLRGPEVIVVDDGRCDATARIVQGFPVRFSPRAHRLEGKIGEVIHWNASQRGPGVAHGS